MVVALALVCYPLAGLAQNPTVTITVDATADRRPIDPNVYGVAHATTAQLNDLNTPLNRHGGNNTTRYNWQLNADNRGNDWYYQSIADSSATAGERGDTFIANARAANARAMLTIPTDRLGRQGRAGPNQARGIFDREVRRADRQRLAVVRRCGQRRPDQRAVRHGQRSERRQRAVERGLSTGLDPASGLPLGHERGRWLALLHSRQRAEHLALDPSGRAPDRSDHGRDPRPDGRFRGEDQNGRPVGARGRTRGMGLERLLLQRVRSAIRKHARVGVAAGSQQSRRVRTI